MHPLVKYWLEIGKVTRERNTPTSKWRYFLNHKIIGELELKSTWKDFFYWFDRLNHSYFLDDELSGIYDPWENMGWVNITVGKGILQTKTDQKFQVVEQLL